MRANANTVSRTPLALGALIALTGSASAAVINDGGQGLRVEVNPDLSMQVYRGESPLLTGPGIVASVDGRLIGAGIEGGSAWTPVWQSRVTGIGSAAQPFQLVTIAGVNGAVVTATTTYVTGHDTVDISFHVDADQKVRLYHLIDAYGNSPLTSYWTGDAASPSALGILGDTAQVAMIAGDTAWNYFHAGEPGIPAYLATVAHDLGNELDGATDFQRSLGVEWTYPLHAWPEELTYSLQFVAIECDHCDAPPAGDQGEPGLGGSGLEPGDDNGWGSDDVGPPPTGPNAVPVAHQDPNVTNDGDEDEPEQYGSATDDDAGGCSAGGGVSGGATLVLMALALGCLGRRARGARAARCGTR